MTSCNEQTVQLAELARGTEGRLHRCLAACPSAVRGKSVLNMAPGMEKLKWSVCDGMLLDVVLTEVVTNFA